MTLHFLNDFDDFFGNQDVTFSLLPLLTSDNQTSIPICGDGNKTKGGTCALKCHKPLTSLMWNSKRFAHLDVEDGEKECTVRVDLPGVAKEDIQVHFDDANHMLTIEAERHEERTVTDGEASGDTTDATTSETDSTTSETDSTTSETYANTSEFAETTEPAETYANTSEFAETTEPAETYANTSEFAETTEPAENAEATAETIDMMAKTPETTAETTDMMMAKTPETTAETIDMMAKTPETTAETTDMMAKTPETKPTTRFIFRERHYGKIQRSITLPHCVDGENVKTVFDNGVLTITFGKRAGGETRKKICIN